MALMTTTIARTITNRLAKVYRELLTIADTSAGSATAGTSRKTIETMLADAVGSADYNVEQDFNADFRTFSDKVNAQGIMRAIGVATVLGKLDTHCASNGPAVASAITSLSTFLSYYNGGAGGNAFANMLHPDFAALWSAIQGSSLALPAAGIASPYIGPTHGASPQANGLGVFTLSAANTGSFTDGSAVVTASYSEVNLVCEVITNFASGGSAPTIAILTGQATDNTGVTTTTWNAATIPGGNNPPSAFTQKTITSGAITAGLKSTVTLASTAGMAVGAWVTINSGLPDQEHVLVEALVANTSFTAVFLKAHNASATVDGRNSVALTVGTAGRRCRDIIALTAGTSGASLTTDGHDAGAIRIVGVQDFASF